MNPAFELAAADGAVTALLGTDPTRFYPFGEAEQDAETPYAVWQTVYGGPWNVLNEVAREDRWGVQVDVYGDLSTETMAIAQALRDAFERDCNGYVMSLNGDYRESDTRLFRSSFTVEFNRPRTS